MRIQSCEQPKRIYNTYLKEHMYVPCGKCNTCMQRKSFSWVKRLERESSCHRYVVFLTLTYDEDHCPFYDFNTYTCKNGLDFDDTDLINFHFDDRTAKLIASRSGRVLMLNYRDIQLFFKRLRQNIHYNYGKERRKNLCSENIEPTVRYWVTGEYGPTTFRPHYHIIIWYDSEFINERIDSLLRDSWSVDGRSIGLIDWSYVTSSAYRYVAQYVNCNSHLPSLLTLPKIRPFGRGSRRPPIGTLLQSSEELQKIFHQGLVYVSIPQKSSHPINVPLFSSLKNRLFPRCLRFSSVDSVNRVTCYKLGRRFPKREEFDSEDQFLTFIRDIVHYFDDFVDTSSFEYFYVKEITDGFSDIRPLLRQLDICRRVEEQSSIFGVSVDYYVSRIENYYLNCEKEIIKNWYLFADEYSKFHDHRDLYFMDLDFIQELYDSLSKIPSIMLDNYDLVKFSSDLKNFDLDRLDDFHQMKFLSQKIVHDTSKTKKKNDYLMAHPELAYFNNF